MTVTLVILHWLFEIQEIDEEDERIMEAFLSKEPGCQKSLADIIVERIKEKDVSVASGDIKLHFIFFIFVLLFGLFLAWCSTCFGFDFYSCHLWIVLCAENRPVPKLDKSIIDIYKGYLQFPVRIIFYKYVE